MGDTAGQTADVSRYAVTLEQLLLAFSWAADEAGYDLDETNSVALLILRAWRTVETRGAWQQPGESSGRPKPRILDQVTESIPVVGSPDRGRQGEPSKKRQGSESHWHRRQQQPSQPAS